MEKCLNVIPECYVDTNLTKTLFLIQCLDSI